MTVCHLSLSEETDCNNVPRQGVVLIGTTCGVGDGDLMLYVSRSNTRVARAGPCRRRTVEKAVTTA